MFIDYLQYERNYSVHTFIAYTNDLLQFVSFIGEKEISEGESFDLERIDSDIVRQWMMALISQSLSPASVNRKLSALQSFFKYLIRRKIVEKHPFAFLSGPKKAKSLPYFVKEKEMERVLDDEDGNIGFGNVRDKLMVEMLYETGIRCSELVGIKNVDVDLDAMLLKVTGKRNKQRLIPFAERLKEMIVYYNNVRGREVATNSPSFFVRKDGRPVSPAVVYYIVRKKLSDIPTLSKRSPHVLRHTFATGMLNNGAKLSAIKNLLGHSSLASTSVYTHVTFEELKKMYNAHPRAKK
ncbi:MAG: tyrosine-type recombinase/integrase [Prevotellaceae bacterium]|jgi:integrase/recombinase XerC|nr:tyrosine-type recombinase/integrase [Prevotellaceae bacterium]